MQLSTGWRYRLFLTRLTLAFGILSAPSVARADFLVNDLSAPVSSGMGPQDPSHVAPAVAFSPVGLVAERTAEVSDGNGLLALLGICIHPPINDPSSPPTKIGGTGGSNPPPVHIASASPEPGTLVIGLIGVGLAGVTRLLRRK